MSHAPHIHAQLAVCEARLTCDRMARLLDDPQQRHTARQHLPALQGEVNVILRYLDDMLVDAATEAETPASAPVHAAPSKQIDIATDGRIVQPPAFHFEAAATHMPEPNFSWHGLTLPTAPAARKALPPESQMLGRAVLWCAGIASLITAVWFGAGQ